MHALTQELVATALAKAHTHPQYTLTLVCLHGLLCMRPQVDFAKIGWDADTSATARDLWEHKDLGTFKGAYPNTTVAPHSTVVLRLTKA